MLTLTPNAAEVINTIVNQPGVPDGAGMRIAVASEAADETPDLRLSVVEGAKDNDEVVTGLPVFVDEQATDYLDDKVLDAEVEGEQVRFSLHPQAGPDIS
ncbi:MAG: HesB/YadR/YfhF-family protein [Gaiellaceae bacterium]